MTTAEAAAMLGLSPAAFTRLAEAMGLKAQIYGKTKVWDRAEVEAIAHAFITTKELATRLNVTPRRVAQIAQARGIKRIVKGKWLKGDWGIERYGNF